MKAPSEMMSKNYCAPRKLLPLALVEQGPLWDGDVPSKTGRAR